MRTILVCLLAAGLAVGLAAQPGKEPPAPAAVVQQPRTVLVIHGGAGIMSDAKMKEAGLTPEDFEKVLAQSLRTGYDALNAKGNTSTHAVEAAIRVLEDCELFNAGRGGVFTSDGRVELDASIMQGTMVGSGEGKRDPKKRAGAVTGVTHVKNPISAARAVMEMEGSVHSVLGFDGAEQFALSEAVREKYKIERVSNLYFWTDRRLKQIRDAHAKGDTVPPRRGDALAPELKFGTVGAVAVDATGGITAGTSTGGLSNKWPGRIGDTPMIGCGTYADDRACGVSGTGTGELFIRHAIAHDVAARMLYAKSTVAEAARDSIDSLPDEPGGVGGLIALDGQGRHAFGLSKKCDGMYRGYITDKGEAFVAVKTGELKPVK